MLNAEAVNLEVQKWTALKFDVELQKLFVFPRQGVGTEPFSETLEKLLFKVLSFENLKLEFGHCYTYK